MFIGRDADGSWTDKDRVLSVALTRYESSLCTCGYPRHICQDPDNDGYFDVEPVVCYAQAAIDEHTSGTDYKAEPGERLGAIFTRETLGHVDAGLNGPVMPAGDDASDGLDAAT